MQPKITTTKDGHFAIEGELNNQTVPEVSKQLNALISDIKSTSIVLDLAEVTRSDSAGVALLVEVMQRTKSAGLSLLLSNLPQQMQDIASLSGLLDILPIDKN